MKKITFPLEHHAEVIGVFAERQDAQRRLAGYAIITVIGIFLILLSVLKRFRLAVLTFITLPIALVGGVIGNYIAGGVISIGSLVGFFTVLGIVARNGIMMISHFQHLEDEEGVPFGPGARPPRGAGAGRSDHDDGADDRAGARAADPRRQHRRSGDRVPDGRRDPRRSHLLDGHQPVRRALPLPPLGQEQAGTGDRRRRTGPA